MPLPNQVFDLNRRAGISEDLIDLAGNFPYHLARSGYAIVYARAGSNPAGRLLLHHGGRVSAFSPGDTIQGSFRDARIELASGSATIGTARLILIDSPEVDYRESAKGIADGCLRSLSYAATANSTANVPSAITDGISLIGVTGIRTTVSAANGQTLSGAGTVVYWCWSDVLARWAESAEVSYTQDVSGRRDASFPNEEIRVSQGRIFVEARSVTVSAGALVVTLETWGVV